jgi:hypothetical protein
MAQITTNKYVIWWGPWRGLSFRRYTKTMALIYVWGANCGWIEIRRKA